MTIPDQRFLGAKLATPGMCLVLFRDTPFRVPTFIDDEQTRMTILSDEGDVINVGSTADRTKKPIERVLIMLRCPDDAYTLWRLDVVDREEGPDMVRFLEVSGDQLDMYPTHLQEAVRRYAAREEPARDEASQQKPIYTKTKHEGWIG